MERVERWLGDRAWALEDGLRFLRVGGIVTDENVEEGMIVMDVELRILAFRNGK